MSKAISIVLSGLVLLYAAGVRAQSRQDAFPVFYREAAPFKQAIEKTEPWGIDRAVHVNGLIAPHHLLVADVIAVLFASVAERDYERVVILCPDHYGRSRTPFAVSPRDFETVLGRVRGDPEFTRKLAQSPLCAPSTLFVTEHGVRALLPFIAHYLPEARVVPVAAAPGATREQSQALAALLIPLLDQRTLVVQSTDYSHGLPLSQARRRDRESLRALRHPEPISLFRLSQPENVDSLACQYVQRLVQKERFQAFPSVLINTNSQFYAARPQPNTTSYIAAIYAPVAIPVPGTQTGSTPCPAMSVAEKTPKR